MKVLAFFLVFLLNWILRCFEQIQSKIYCRPSGLAKTTSQLQKLSSLLRWNCEAGNESSSNFSQLSSCFYFSLLGSHYSLLANHTSEKWDVNSFNHHIHDTIVFKIDKISLFLLIIFTDRGFNPLSLPKQKTVQF